MIASSRTSRRGFLLAEVAVAAFLLILALVMTVKMLGWVAADRRASERRGWALQEAANVMEILSALPFDQLSQDTVSKAATLSDDARAVLPEASLKVQVADDPPMKRIDLAVTWQGASGLNEAPVRLTSWVAHKGVRP